MADVRPLTDPAVEAAATRLHWLHGAPPAGVPCDPGPVEAARRAAAALHEIARWTEQAASARRALVSAEAELAALHTQLNRLGYTAVGGGA